MPEWIEDEKDESIKLPQLTRPGERNKQLQVSQHQRYRGGNRCDQLPILSWVGALI